MSPPKPPGLTPPPTRPIAKIGAVRAQTRTKIRPPGVGRSDGGRGGRSSARAGR